MKDKEKLSMYVDIIKITIIICWVSLVCFWLLKIFGGNLFEIMVENENFLKFSELVQNSWLKYLVSFITIGVAKYFTFCAICQKLTFKNKDLFIILGLILSIWFVVNFVNIEFIKMFYGYLIMALVGVIYQKGWKKLFGLIGIASEFIFSTISMIVRNIELQFVTDYLIIMILLIDVYIMIILYYLYANLITFKKEIE